MKRSMSACVIAAALPLLLASSLAQAHLLPKQSATMRIIDNAAFFVVSVPVSTLAGVDDDANGVLSPQEIRQHNDDLQRQFLARFHVSDADNASTPVLTLILSPQTDGVPTDTDYIVVMHRVNFQVAPRNPVLSTDLFGSRRDEGQMTLAATKGTATEIAVLDAGNPRHGFFRGRLALLRDFIRVGVTHILSGPDHLLFLLTIIVAATGWRYWLAVVTSFTLGHSITLALSALNLLRVPSAIVEPGIAASIVLTAMMNLRRGDKTQIRPSWPRIGVGFGCGLLHGLGFASAIASMGADTASRVATLAGFNIGIELGQFIFLAGVLTTAAALRRAGRGFVPPDWPRLVSTAAALAGAMLLVQRIGTPW